MWSYPILGFRVQQIMSNSYIIALENKKPPEGGWFITSKKQKPGWLDHLRMHCRHKYWLGRTRHAPLRQFPASDPLTEIIRFTQLNTVMTQDAVSGGDMEIKIRDDPSKQILLAHKLKAPLFN